MKNLVIGTVVITVFGLALFAVYALGPKKQSISSTSEVSVSPTQIPPTPTIDETESLKQEIKLALVAEHGPNAENLDITVSKISGAYAQGGASEPGVGGGMWFAAKVGESWKLVWDGNGIITCDDLKDYSDYPSTMIPECYDESSQDMVKR